MASKTAQATSGQSDFFKIGNRFFCSFLGSLFNHFLTKFWTPLGVSLGVSWEPCRASWDSLGRPLDPKTLKNCGFFKVFENAAFWLFEAPDGSLGLILPPLWPIWSQNGPQNGSQNYSKKHTQIWPFFPIFFLMSWHHLLMSSSQFWNPFWTHLGLPWATWGHLGPSWAHLGPS